MFKTPSSWKNSKQIVKHLKTNVQFCTILSCGDCWTLANWILLHFFIFISLSQIHLKIPQNLQASLHSLNGEESFMFLVCIKECGLTMSLIMDNELRFILMLKLGFVGK